MHEIKFRAWDKIEKKWINNVLYSSEWQQFCYVQNNSFIWQDKNNFNIVEYTGLKDKNRKEIFEKDIIILNKLDDRKFVVIENYLDWYGSHEYCLHCEIGNIEDDIEIIGNIYENPELLNEKY